MAQYLVLDTTRDLFGGLRGENFRLLMQFCFNEADRFALSKMALPSYPNYVEDLLAPYLVTTTQVTEWFAYNGGTPIIELVYKASPETMAIMLNYFQDVFLDNKKRIPKKKYEQVGKQFLYPSVLENICFSKNRKMFLGTLSHEYICAARCISKDFEEKLLSIASWEQVTADIYNLNLTQF